MARADLLCELIRAGLRKDDMTFRRATQAICAEERTKQHEILANKIEELLRDEEKREKVKKELQNEKIDYSDNIKKLYNLL